MFELQDVWYKNKNYPYDKWRDEQLGIMLCEISEDASFISFVLIISRYPGLYRDRIRKSCLERRRIHNSSKVQLLKALCKERI